MGDWESSGWVRLNASDVHLTVRDINPILRRIVGNKAASIANYPEIRKEIGNLYADAVRTYVPYDSGRLVNSGTGTSDGRVYWTATAANGYNYAYIQYTDESFKHPARHNNMPQAYWTDRVHPGTLDWYNFIEDVKRVLIAHFNEA